MSKKILFFLILLSVFLVPFTAHAAVDSIQSLMRALVGSALWAVFTGIVVICFIYSGVMFLSSGGEPAKLQKARSSFLWGIAGVVVGILAYSIVSILEKVIS
jgi:hypothetical protein